MMIAALAAAVPMTAYALQGRGYFPIGNPDLAFDRWMLAMGWLTAMLLVLVLLIWPLRWLIKRGSRRMVSRMLRTDPAFGYYAACCLHGEHPRENWWRGRRTRWITTLREHSQARAFVRPAYLARLSAYPIISQPIEPERIGGALALGEMRVLIIGSLIGAFMAYQFSILSVVGVGIVVLAAFIRLLWRGALFTPMIAGQGWVEHGSSRWTVQDSVLVVTGLTRADIRLVGPQGVLRLRLSMKPGADGQLATLWTRWMHPHPLLEQHSFEE